MEGTLCFCLISALVLVTGLWTQCESAGDSAPQSPVLSGPDMAYLDERIVFRCEAPSVPRPITYEMLRDRQNLSLAVQTPELDRPAMFQLVVHSNSSGRYHCRARPGRDPNSSFLSSNSHLLQVVIPVRGAGLVADPDPPVVWEGESLTLRCEVREGSHLFYRWYRNREELPHLSRFPGQQMLAVHSISERDAGWYYCMVGNIMKNSRVSNSQEVEVRVKVNLSEPQISFSVTKHDSGYCANVKCWSARGSLPVWFWLVRDNITLANRTTGSLSTVFSVPVSLGQSLGQLQCRAGNRGNHHLHSQPLNLEVVPVGGAVQLQVEYLYSADSRAVGVVLQCVVSHGTFPIYTWFLNHTHLQGDGESYIITQHGHTLFLPFIIAGNSGYYHCQAEDSFDNTSWIQSQIALIQNTELTLVSSEIIAVVFCCFLLLAIVGSMCCIFTLNNRRTDSDVEPRSSDLVLSIIGSSSEDPTVDS